MPSYTPSVVIKVYEGVRLARYNYILAFFAFAWAAIEFFRRIIFNSQRWAAVAED